MSYKNKKNIFLVLIALVFLGIEPNLAFCVNDSSAVRHISKTELKQLQQSTDYKDIFEYKEEIEEQNSWFVKWLTKSLRILLENNFVRFLFDLLPYIIIIIVVVLIVLKFSNIELNALFGRKTKSIKQVEIVESVEDIDQFPIEDLLFKAEQKGDYKLMIRYAYLILLKKLNEQNLIVWKKHKSNFDYIYETRSRSFSNIFIDLTRSYEYVWYGEMNIKTDHGKRIFEEMRNFERKIKE
jgi:hypothetical protein